MVGTFCWQNTRNSLFSLPRGTGGTFFFFFPANFFFTHHFQNLWGKCCWRLDFLFESRLTSVQMIQQALRDPTKFLVGYFSGCTWWAKKQSLSTSWYKWDWIKSYKRTTMSRNTKPGQCPTTLFKEYNVYDLLHCWINMRINHLHVQPLMYCLSLLYVLYVYWCRCLVSLSHR